MKTVRWHIDTGYPIASHSGSFTVDDNETDEAIEAMVREEMFERISYSWKVE